MSVVEGGPVDLERSELVRVSKPLFYGYITMAGLSLLSMPEHTGKLMGLSMVPAIGYVSAGLSEGLEGDWQSLLDLISITALLLSILLGTYISTLFAFT